MGAEGRRSAGIGAFLLVGVALWPAGRAAAQVAGDAAAPPPRALPADTLPGELDARHLDGGPLVVVYRQAGEPLAAVRVSFALDSAGGDEAALGGLVQRLTRRSMETEAARFGARVTLGHTPGHAVFTIVGAAQDFPALLGVIRRGVAWRDPSAAQVEAARLRAATEALSAAETPDALLRRRVLAMLFPLLPSAPGAVPPAGAVTRESLRAFWARSFRPERMQVVVVGGVSPAAAEEFRGWPAPDEGGGAGGAEASLPARRGLVQRPPRAQVLFPRAAAAYPSEASPAVLAVTARLLEQRLRELPLRGPRAEFWWDGADRAIVLEGSAGLAPADGAGGTRPGAADRGRGSGAGSAGPADGESLEPADPVKLLATAVRDAASQLTPEAVAEARAAVTRDILLSARTAEGLAGYLGELFERTGHPEGGQEFLRALAAVNGEDVGQVIDELRSSTPVVEAVRR